MFVVLVVEPSDKFNKRQFAASFNNGAIAEGIFRTVVEFSLMPGQTVVLLQVGLAKTRILDTHTKVEE